MDYKAPRYVVFSTPLANLADNNKIQYNGINNCLYMFRPILAIFRE